MARLVRLRFEAGRDAVAVLHLAAALAVFERNRLRRMVNSQADILVPGSKESILVSARSSSPCTRSSARSILPQSDIANACNRACRQHGLAYAGIGSFRRSLPPGLSSSRKSSTIGQASARQTGVQGAQLAADLGLNVWPRLAGFFPVLLRSIRWRRRCSWLAVLILLLTGHATADIPSSWYVGRKRPIVRIVPRK